MTMTMATTMMMVVKMVMTKLLTNAPPEQLMQATGESQGRHLVRTPMQVNEVRSAHPHAGE